MAEPEFRAESRIHEVLAIGERGRELLWRHGYDAGEGFVDALSQYQTLTDAWRAGRLRDISGLVTQLNAHPGAHKK
jgi:hypothetical protein